VPIKKEKQPLSVTHPQLAKEADGWDPEVNFSNSAKKLKWKCSKGHKWEQLIRNRTGRGRPGYKSECPICSSLFSKFPKLAKEADGWDPKAISAYNNKMLQWKCPKGHRFKSTVSNRANGGKCSVCAGRQILIGYNDLKTTHPKLAKEADGWDPKTVTQGSNLKKKWICRYGHKWSAVVGSRSQGNNCPICGKKTVLKGFNDLKTTNPKLAKEADGWDPTKYREGSGKKLPWKCSKGHKWEAVISNRSRGSRCLVCSDLLLLKGFNDLKTTHPHLAKEADGWDPTKIMASSTKKLKWKCKYGHKWEALGFSRVKGNKGKGLGCPTCSNQKVLVGFNDFKTTHPELAKFADGWDTTKYVAGSRAIVKWKCKNKHKWEAPLNKRVKNRNCAYCSGDLIWKGFNDLKTTHPNVAIEAYKWDPSTLMAGSLKKVNWKCKVGHIWKTSVAIRTRKMRPSDCPTCAATGFDGNKNGWFYFLYHPKWELYQVGITNYPTERIALHKGRGWIQIELRGPVKGTEARKIEKSVLQALKSNGAKIVSKNSPKKFDGYTEAWSRSTFEAKSIRELVRLTEKFERKKTK
jgi:hypothetical protein